MVRRLGGLARRAAWRVLHPSAREPYLAESRLRPLDRLYYATVDGWRAPLFWVPPAPGTAGEPVVVAHALGLSPDAFRVDDSVCLATRLSRAGFGVYLLAHRGDGAAIPPSARAPFDFDDILERDVPAALARVAEHSGFPRAHWIGHGLGGQLGLAWAGRGGPGALASVVALAAPVAFDEGRARSELRHAGWVAASLPAHWRLPMASIAWAVAPWVGDGGALEGFASAATAGPTARGVLVHGVEDPAVGLLRQVGRWGRDGAWTDRTRTLDYAASLAAADAPLLVVAGADDAVCPASCAVGAVARWGGDGRALVVDGLGHLDLLTGVGAVERVVDPIVGFLRSHRRRAWAADAEDRP